VSEAGDNLLFACYTATAREPVQRPIYLGLVCRTPVTNLIACDHVKNYVVWEGGGSYMGCHVTTPVLGSVVGNICKYDPRDEKPIFVCRLDWWPRWEYILQRILE